jgi:hypothetical protein
MPWSYRGVIHMSEICEGCEASLIEECLCGEKTTLLGHRLVNDKCTQADCQLKLGD